MTIKKQIFGVLSSGDEVNIYTFSNGRITFSAIEYGCAITSILVPDKNGITADVTLGFPTMDGYVLVRNGGRLDFATHAALVMSSSV